ncbi:MAG: PEP/pyruvate-binding domain-containing protein [Thermoanaerobaculales bacterium]
MVGIDPIELTSRYGMRTEEFSALMQHRVKEILLVASHYDSFILEEDGQLTELIFEEYRNLDLNLRFAPRFKRASNGSQALQFLKERSFDMVISTPRLPDMKVGELLHSIKQEHPDLAVGLLAAHSWELPWLDDIRAGDELDYLFLWQGNVQALMAMIKQVEDRLNAEHDILSGGVQAIILVEDEPRFYSVYLPHIYTEVTRQTSRLMAEGLNLSHRLLRIRARPKILLAQSFEEALELYRHFAGNILGIISDVSFPRDGAIDDEAGVRLAKEIHQQDPDLPFLLQSMDQKHEETAKEVGVQFLWKQSPHLLEKLRKYILDHFGFGDFIFKLPSGEQVARASNMREMLIALGEVPDESLVFHARRNHFSAWLKARTEFELASMLRPRKVADFDSPSDLREFLIGAMITYLREIRQHVITDFDGDRFTEFTAFAKIGSGSLGGKGRGLAFMHKILARQNLAIERVQLSIPQTVVLASDVFEEFLEDNQLRGFVARAGDLGDEEVLDYFRRSRFRHKLRSDLGALLERVCEPIAIRSSSILEDSVYQPFAGVYATIMLPNNHPSLDIRLAQLLEAVKVVYASTYFRQARDYLETTPYRIEEELMAVLVQRLVGRRRGDRFYPTFSGVAASYNFYPFGQMRPSDGVAQVALGLGKSVVEGFEALRFCPRQPRSLPQFSAMQDILRNAQRRFYALDMSRNDIIPGVQTDSNLLHHETSEAVDDGAAAPIASTYDRANDRLVSGVDDVGAPLITFEPLLKGRILPLPEILSRLLEVCAEGIASPVEIEFAADLEPGLEHRQVFNILQLRPMVFERMDVEVNLDDDGTANAFVQSDLALGHGRRETIADLLVIDPRRLSRSDTGQVATIVERINRELRREDRHSILIGPGRWGSRDPWLGIPVTWPQISSARAIVETDFDDLQVEPSLGSHFFHNLTCYGVAFFAIHKQTGGGRIDWNWLAEQTSKEEALDGALRHLRLESPAQVMVDGSTSRGVILGPIPD